MSIEGGTDGIILTENEITKYKSYNSYSQITSSPYSPYTHNFLQHKEFLLLIANDPNFYCFEGIQLKAFQNFTTISLRIIIKWLRSCSKHYYYYHLVSITKLLNTTYNQTNDFLRAYNKLYLIYMIIYNRPRTYLSMTRNIISWFSLQFLATFWYQYGQSSRPSLKD